MIATPHSYLQLLERRLPKLSLNLQRQDIGIMSYTKEPIVIDNLSEKLLKTIKKLREHKLSEQEKHRNMKPEEFPCRMFWAKK